VQSYHSALQTNKVPISTFYCRIPETIVWNGNVLSDGMAVQEIFAKQLPNSCFDVQSVDCHIINKNYPVPDQDENATRRKNVKDHISMVVVVSGSVKLGGSEVENDERGFSETLVLIPNTNIRRKEHDRNRKDFVIQSQNFRVVA
jgi:NTF2-related export protein 1/2